MDIKKSCTSSFSLLAVPAPFGLSFGEVTADTMLVTWKAPQVPKASEINRYIIRYHPIDDDDDTIERTVDGNTNYIVLPCTLRELTLTCLSSPVFSFCIEHSLMSLFV